MIGLVIDAEIIYNRREFIFGRQKTMSEKLLLRTTPAEVGVEESAIIKMLDGFKEKQLGVHGIMLLRHGKVFAEGYYAPYRSDLTHMMYSLSKPFTSTAIGFAIEEGLITLDDRLVDFFPEKLDGRPCENMEKITVRHLLTMNSGHKYEPDFVRDAPDWAEVFLKTYVDFEPGTKFTYNTFGTYMLSAVINRVTGMPVEEYLKPRLLDPLGIEDYRFEKCPAGISTGGYGFNLKLESVAKFGQFCLNRGMWEGRQLISSDWIDAATSKQVPTPPATPDWDKGYGYQFWRCAPEGSYRGDGACGQFIIVLPKEDMVIAMFEGLGDMQEPLDVLWETILPGLHDSTIPENSEMLAEMNSRLCSLSVRLPEGAPDSPLASKYSGINYKISENASKITEMQFDLSTDNKSVRIMIDGHDVRIPLRYGCFAETETGIKAEECNSYTTLIYERCAGSMAWKDDNTLSLCISCTTTPFTDDVTVKFDESGIIVSWNRRISMGIADFTVFGRTE